MNNNKIYICGCCSKDIQDQQNLIKKKRNCKS